MKEVNLPTSQRAYINVMESLVAQEVGQQLQDVPTKIRRFLKMEEIVTYALNRLPALYASSEKGWEYQRQLAKRDMHRKIKEVVRQAIMAVQVDPLRLSQPLQTHQNREAEAVLQALRAFFKTPDLDWSTALKKLVDLKKNPLSLEQVLAQNSHAWQPAARSGQIAWTHRRRQPRQQEEANLETASQTEERPYGWDNVLYRL